jgi:hypothetical protein
MYIHRVVCVCWAHPDGQVFVRGLLEHLKVNPQVFRREQYKAALAPLTNQSFDDDPAYKENITSLLQACDCS